MNLIDLGSDGQYSLADASGRIYGVVTGVVTDNKDDNDPAKLGRVKVQFPWLAEDAESPWARVATPMAGKQRGLFCLPEVGDEVLVAFEHGDPGHPYVLGGLWNGKDEPPAANPDGKNDQRLLRSRSGLTLLLDDASGKERIVVADKDGKQSVLVDVANKKVVVASGGDVEITAEQGTVSITAKTLKLSSSGATELKASGNLDLGGNTVNVKGQPTVNIN